MRVIHGSRFPHKLAWMLLTLGCWAGFILALWNGVNTTLIAFEVLATFSTLMVEIISLENEIQELKKLIKSLKHNI